MMYTYQPGGKPEDILDKDELVVGKTYRGRCRNADEAVWNGQVFEYQRNKFGHIFTETIQHPEDFCGFDVFMPSRKLNERL